MINFFAKNNIDNIEKITKDYEKLNHIKGKVEYFLLKNKCLLEKYYFENFLKFLKEILNTENIKSDDFKKLIDLYNSDLEDIEKVEGFKIIKEYYYFNIIGFFKNLSNRINNKEEINYEKEIEKFIPIAKEEVNKFSEEEKKNELILSEYEKNGLINQSDELKKNFKELNEILKKSFEYNEYQNDKIPNADNVLEPFSFFDQIINEEIEIPKEVDILENIKNDDDIMENFGEEKLSKFIKNKMTSKSNSVQYIKTKEKYIYKSKNQKDKETKNLLIEVNYKEKTVLVEQNDNNKLIKFESLPSGDLKIYENETEIGKTKTTEKNKKSKLSNVIIDESGETITMNLNKDLIEIIINSKKEDKENNSESLKINIYINDKFICQN